MHTFVDNILAPYFVCRKTEFGLPLEQKALWQIDMWSVHRSEEFRGWMKANHPNIILDFVPGGCTSVHQPCNVGNQQPLKLSIQKSYHEDIVVEFVGQLNNGNTILKIDDSIGVLHDCSVGWMWNAFLVLKNKELIKKVCPCYSYNYFKFKFTFGSRLLKVVLFKNGIYHMHA